MNLTELMCVHEPMYMNLTELRDTESTNNFLHF